jgi:hypothetical protein
MANEIKIESWKMLTEFFEESKHHLHNYHAYHIQFRGQPNKEWKLSSSLQRILIGDQLSEEKAKYYETQAQSEFLSQAHLLKEIRTYDPSAEPVSMIVDMQHYSCPTRLIDWSGSPYIALYFAVRENPEMNGTLYIWDVRFYKKNMEALSLDSSKLKPLEIMSFNKFDFVQLVFPTIKNQRIVSQQGCFTISNNILKNHCDLIVEAGKKAKDHSGLYKLEIPSELKFEFLARLRSMNISANSLFHGPDGLGRSIHENLKLRRWSKR